MAPKTKTEGAIHIFLGRDNKKNPKANLKEVVGVQVNAEENHRGRNEHVQRRCSPDTKMSVSRCTV